MAQVIQNVECYELQIDKNTRRVYLEDLDFLSDRIIDSFFLFSNRVSSIVNYPNMFMPFSIELSEDNSLQTRIENIDLFLSLMDKDKSTIISNFNAKLVYTSRIDSNEGLLPLNINRKINFKDSYLSCNSLTEDVSRILLYVAYRNRPLECQDDRINGSCTIKFPPVYEWKFDPDMDEYDWVRVRPECEDFKLSDFVKNTLRGKKIKRIVYSGKGFSYLYLKNDNSLIDNIPCSSLLNLYSDDIAIKGFLFDNMEIDFENSYFKRRGSGATIVPSSHANTEEYVTFYF